MVFSSSVFLFLFLPLTLALYFLPLSRNKQKEISKKNFVLLAVSLIFYAWGEPTYIILMLISIYFNFNIGVDIEHQFEKGRKRTAKLIFLCAVLFNLFVLGYFKYAGFITENLNSIFGLSLENNNLPLPVGISFYTFQILSYVVDVYCGKVKAQKKLIPFAAYITMFPQLIAGPIVQYSDIERQLTDRAVTKEKFADGIIFFVRGLGKKVLFANTIGAVYTEILGFEIQEMSMATAWIGIFCYTLQIYFDFSGYSDMAVGLGKMLGFEFVRNFNFPYTAISITDFWRRWHISLSSWFRDYVYIPLGGNRKGTARTILNILIVWSLTGLWHGAEWTFIAWGGFYGILLLAEKYLLKDILKHIPLTVRRILTLIVVMIGWVFFSSTDISSAFSYLGAMFGIGSNPIFDSTSGYLLSSNGFAIVLMSLSAFGFFEAMPRPKNKYALVISNSVIYVVIFVLCIAYLISETYNPFLYFRF
ncbi:MAG: MBOAT family protein [Clostridia bacterium]|nr:MBOAT family protein [Clostridia bacterium]